MVRKLLRVRARPCWGKCVLKMGPLGRPGHAVSLCGKSFGSEVMKTRKAAKPSFFFRGSGCNEGSHSVGRLFGGWIVCEIVQNRRKTNMIRPKAGKFFSGFRRDV